MFKYGEEISTVCDCPLEEKINSEGFTQNGCYGNQPHRIEALIFKGLIALTSAVSAPCKTRFDFQTSTSCKFLSRCVQSTKVLTINSCFQCFLHALSRNSLILH